MQLGIHQVGLTNLHVKKLPRELQEQPSSDALELEPPPLQLPSPGMGNSLQMTVTYRRSLLVCRPRIPISLLEGGSDIPTNKPEGPAKGAGPGLEFVPSVSGFCSEGLTWWLPSLLKSSPIQLCQEPDRGFPGLEGRGGRQER